MTKYNVKKIEITNTMTTTLSTVCKKQSTAENRFTRFLETYDSCFAETMLKCFMDIKPVGYVNGELISQATIKENEYTMSVQISDNTYIIYIEFKHDDNTTSYKSLANFTSNNTNTTDSTTETTTDNTTKTESGTNSINNVLESIVNKQLIQKYVDGINNGLQNDIYKQTLEIITKLEKLFDTAEKYKNSFSWYHDNGNIKQRECREKQDSIDEFEWYENGDKYTAEYTVRIRRYNVYAYGTYTKNGIPTTLTAIKNSYKRLVKDVQRE